MFEKLKQVLRSLATPPKPFDPAVFGDPLATRTEWTPLARGGANFRTHKLRRSDPGRIEFRATTGLILFSLVFFLAGLGVFAVFFAIWSRGDAGPAKWGFLMPLALGLLFMTIGARLFYSATAPVVFDKGQRIFWKGRKGPDEALGSGNSGAIVRLDHVHAIQIIPEYISGKSSYHSYELNLVLEDGKRANVVDHGNLDRLREDAKELGIFLGKPLWDATVR